MEWIQKKMKVVYGPAFYQAALIARPAASVRYFLGLMLALSLFSAVSSYTSVGSWLFRSDRVGVMRNAVVDMYPENLVLEYRDGHVTSNVDEPFFIPMPDGLRDVASADSDRKPVANFVVIDTKQTVVPEDFSRFDTLVILGNTALWVNDPQKGIRVVPIDSWSKEPFVLDRAAVSGFVDTAVRILTPILIVGLFLLPIFIFFSLSVGYLFYLLFGALVVLAIAKIRKLDITYVQSYRIGLYLLTVPVIYASLRNLFQISDIPFLFTLIFAVFAFLNLSPPMDAEAVSDDRCDAELRNNADEAKEKQ
ncbi:MAG: DUF1189 family protein [Candidatus Moranbacteria bacterium]|nr:DUF1189 family protein [Candidatus Moranbacteria bacterium]